MLVRGAKYLVPFGMAVFTPAVVYAKEENSELSIKKRAPWDVYCEPPPVKKTTEESKKVAVAELEKCIQKCREDLGPIHSDAVGYVSQARAFLQNACSAVSANITYLQKDASSDVKYATIAGGGVLSGLILGFRKRLFKKLIYLAIGSGATAAVIFPNQTKIMAKEGSVYAKEGFKSAYASITGKDPEQSEQCDKKKKKEKKDSTTKPT